MPESLFECPKCGGVHFHATTTGDLVCSSRMNEHTIGCGWRGVLNEPSFPKTDDTIIPSGNHGPTDRSDMYYTEGYQKWVDARNRAME